MNWLNLGNNQSETNGTNSADGVNTITTDRKGNDTEITESLFAEKAPPVSATNTNISPKVSGLPIRQTAEKNINLLYQFLDKNYEEQGYNDALVNPDTSHMDQNIEAIRHELGRMIRQVRSFYERFLKEIDFHIESRSRSGMVDTVDELKMKKSIAESHLKEVLEIEADAKSKVGDSEGLIISYKRGFRNGLAAISHHLILQKDV